MFVPVSQETAPELAADTQNKWWLIGNEYYQSDDESDGITLEIRRIESGKFRWWLYDANSPDPETAVIESDPDQPTLAAALADIYDYLSGYETHRRHQA